MIDDQQHSWTTTSLDHPALSVYISYQRAGFDGHRKFAIAVEWWGNKWHDDFDTFDNLDSLDSCELPLREAVVEAQNMTSVENSDAAHTHVGAHYEFSSIIKQAGMSWMNEFV